MSTKSKSATGPGQSLRCERLFAWLTQAADGQPMELVRLLGNDVPSDVEMYFCCRTFTVLQVRIKKYCQPVLGLIHDYAMEPAEGKKSGVYELACTRSEHHLQVKVQPSLGLDALLPATSSSAAPPALEKLQALAGILRMARAFVTDQECVEVDIAEFGLAPAAEELAEFLRRCKVLKLGSDGARKTSVGLADPSPTGVTKSRGMLLKALFELKILLLSAAEAAGVGFGLGAERQQLLQQLLAECFPGGLQAQQDSNASSMVRLTKLICGYGNSAERDAAFKVLLDCMNLCRETVLPKLQRLGKREGLQEPSTQITSDADGVAFKRAYVSVYHAAVKSYLFEEVRQGKTALDLPAACGTMRRMCAKPDAALQLLCPSKDLDLAIASSKADLEILLDELLSTSQASLSSNSFCGAGVVSRSLGAAGLDNPGENLCATNSMVQFLFSVKNFRQAVTALHGIPTLVDPSSARCLALSMSRVFHALADPSVPTASAAEVAFALYGQELGEQQDCDELLHRLSSMLQDLTWSSTSEEELFAAVKQSFERLFIGETYEIQLRKQVAAQDLDDGEIFRSLSDVAARKEVIGFVQSKTAAATATPGGKQFLAIPVQARNGNIKVALEEFVSWSHTGSSKVLLTQEHFKRLPPFLCFAIRQVTDLEWEASLDLAHYVRQAEAATAASLEKSSSSAKLRLEQLEISEAMSHLRRCLSCLEEAEREASPKYDKGAASLRVRELEHLLSMLQSRLEEATAMAMSLDQRSSPNAETASQADGEKYSYDVHAVIVYQGRGQVGHYVSFIRQGSGSFLCFDDEQVLSMPTIEAIKSEIARRSTLDHPASVRTLVYRRRSSSGGDDVPVELMDLRAVLTAVDHKEDSSVEPAWKQARIV